MPEIAPYTLRPAGLDDAFFLQAVFASARERELALLGWSGQQAQAFLAMQTRAQNQHYAAYFPQAVTWIVLRDGTPAGRIIVDRSGPVVCLLDITLLPEHRNAGLGTALIGDLLAEAERDGKRVTLHVEPANPANRLYRRLGFAPVAESSVSVEMEWRPVRLESQTEVAHA